MSQVEQASVLVIQPCFLPILALKVIFDLKVSISLTTDNKKNVLQIFR